jgi:hypothetical protein
MASFSKVANSNIAPSRLVKIDTTADGKVLQCTGTSDVPYGVSQPGQHNTPLSVGGTSLLDGWAATAGQNLWIIGPPDKCLLELGGTVTRGDYLASDTNGKGVTATTGNFYGAQAMESGASGDLVEVMVVLGTR